MQFQDRQYQTDYLDEISANWQRGFRRQLMVAPTGAGKGEMVGLMGKRVADRGKRMLLMADRRRLIEQLAGRMRKFGVRWHVEMANLPDASLPGNEWVRRDPDAPIIVASRDTLLSRTMRNDWMGLPKVDMVCLDECVTGDTVVITESGPTPISELRYGRSTHVLSDGPNGPRFRRVVAFLPRGVRSCMTVTLSSGKTLRCTENHPLFTQRGWVFAGDLTVDDRVMSLACAGAGRWPPSVSGGNSSTFLGTSGASDTEHSTSNGNARSTTNCSATHHSVRAGAAPSCGRHPHRSTSSSSGRRGTSAGMQKVTATGPRTGALSSPTSNGRRSWAHCSETQACTTRTTRRLRRDCLSITPSSKPSGLGTSSECFTGLGGENGSFIITTGMAAPSSWQVPPACDRSWVYTNCAISPVASVSTRGGSTASAGSDWRGGSETTEAPARRPSPCTPRGSRETPSNSSPTGSASGTESAVSSRARSTTPSTSWPMQEPPCGPTSPITFRSACSTRWERVVSLTKNVSMEEVFDITVEDDHNFYANGMLVHNCHLWEKGRGRELAAAVGAPFLLGMTATPCYGDGTGLGRDNWDVIVERVTMRELIEKKFLVPVKYFAPPELGKKRVAGEKTGVSGDPVKHWMDHAEGKRTVAFLEGVKQAYAVRDRFRAAGVTAEVIEADTPHKDRQRIMDDIAAGKVLWCGGVGTLTTGVDVPEWEVCQLLIKCGSFVKYRQCGGRVMRTCPDLHGPGKDKEYAIFLDHSAAVMEHGFLDEPVTWELDDTDITERVKKEREADGERANPVCCANCGCLFAGSPVCPECGTAIPRRERKQEPDIHRELLVELDAPQETPGQLAMRKQREWTVFLRMCVAKGWPAKKANVMFKSKFGDWPENMGVTPTFRYGDRDKPVSDLCPNLIRKKN